MMSILKKGLIVSFLMDELTYQVEFAKRKFLLQDSFDPDVEISFRRGTSLGGPDADLKPSILLFAGHVMGQVGTDELVCFNEYTAFENHPRIGTIDLRWDQYLAVVLAHELAHCICEIPKFRRRAEVVVPKKFKDQRAHGLFWQYVYDWLREDALRRNPR